MIAATRQRVRRWTAAADRRFDALLVAAWPRLAATARRARSIAVVSARRAGRLLRPLAVRLFRALAIVERLLLRLVGRARAAATRASAVLTPQRAICLTIAGAAACLVVAQFVDYRAVEVGQQGYAGLPAAEAPTVGAETAGQASAYLLVPVGLLAAALAAWAAIDERRRGLGRIVFALGLLSLGLILIVDLPAGLDAGAEATRFSGAEAVLYDAFYAQIAAAAGLMLGGAMLSYAHRVPTRHGYRPRKPSRARTQGGRRRARTSSA
jgi:hypothetical protein